MIKRTTTEAIRTTRRKVAALIHIGKQSLRSIGQLIDRPKSTVHRHLQSQSFRDQYPESYFWETEAGEAWLRRMVLGVLFIFEMQHAVGADALSDFFKLIRINTHVGVSSNAVLTLLNRMKTCSFIFRISAKHPCPRKPAKRSWRWTKPILAAC